MPDQPDGAEPDRDALTSIRNPQKRRLFEALVERDGAACQHCGAERDLTIDHVDPVGPTIMENLQLLCARCNSAKGNRTEDKAVRWSSSVWQRGFTMIPNRVLLETPLSSNAVRVYLLFTHYSWRPDSEWPGQEAIAVAVGCSEKTLRGAIKELEDAGLVRSLRRGLGKTNCYSMLVPRGGDSSRSGTVDFTVQERSFSPVPSLRAKTEVQDRGAIAPLAPPVESPARNRPIKVNRQPVTDDEYRLAAEVLAAFNEYAGTRYASGEWITKIVCRIREHPGLPLEAHNRIIEAVLADPWWKGDPSPSVVYGNAALFEKNLHVAANRGATVGVSALTPDEMDTYGTVWGPGTPYETPAEARHARAEAVEAEYEELSDAEG